MTAFTYLVASERSDEINEVDISVSICVCEAGKRGKFCKHQAGILKCLSILLPNAPAEARHRIAAVALGDEARHRIAAVALGNEAEPVILPTIKKW